VRLFPVVTFVLLGAGVGIRAARAQDIPRNCDLDYSNRNGPVTSREDIPGKRTIFLSGGVIAHCIGQGNTLTADSAEYYEAEGRLFLVGHVHYTEPRATVTSNTMTFYQNEDRLHAEGNVLALMSNGSTLRGPVADYYRATPQRPLARLIATGRPTITLVQRDTTGRGRPPDTAHVVANTIVTDGDSLVYASRMVQITRPDLLATGDSAFLDSGRDFARLTLTPSVKGIGAHTFTLTGGVVDVYSRNKQVERVVATPTGHALSQDLELVADSIDLRVANNQLQEAFAWGKTRAHALSPEREIIADSIDAIMPGQRVKEVRALRKAYAESNPDSGIVSKQRDWMSGDSIIARFDSVPPTDTTSRPRVRQILALGNARSFYQMKNSKGPQTEPSVNYVRGRIIDIGFEDRKVATVTVTDQATGVMIEPAAEAAQTTVTTDKAGVAAPARTPAPVKTPTPVKPPGSRK
jgi:hypothetical protein